MNKIALAALPIAALLALSGCSGAAPAPAGSSGAAGGASTAPAPAPKKNLPAPGSDVDPAAFADQTVEAVKSIKTATTQFRSTGSVAGTEVDGKGTSLLDRSDPSRLRASSESTSQDGSSLKMVFDGSVVYMNDGKGWTKTDYSKPSDGKGIRIPMTNPADLEKSYDSYKTSVKKVVYVGEANVGGAAASKYTLTMDIGGKTSQIDLYTDAKNRPVKTESQIEGLTSVTESGKFDQPVTITIPTDAREI